MYDFCSAAGAGFCVASVRPEPEEVQKRTVQYSDKQQHIRHSLLPTTLKLIWEFPAWQCTQLDASVHSSSLLAGPLLEFHTASQKGMFLAMAPNTLTAQILALSWNISTSS